MKKKIKNFLIDLFIELVPVYLRILKATSKITEYEKQNIEPFLKEKKPFILSAWHCNVFAGISFVEGWDLYIMVSQSRDGDLITRIVERFSNHAIRGSSHRGGIQALRQLIDLGKQGKRLVITPDGPRGPAFSLQTGVITLASKTGLPIIPYHFESIKQKIVSSWDSHRIPFWFNHIIIRYGNPIYIPDSLDEDTMEYYRKHVEKEMNLNMEKTIQIRNALKGHT